ncbi:hypothetical protein DFH27DRAFT_546200 [Peziza echinospora]|nr:hypothetical protein DFH27DRAFT_546200 [Peziza echinospora]
MASRRQNPSNDKADRAAANQQVIKSLLKLPGNKFCADCKINKLPRWASWNLGIFVCIRCSGIHRGMGTHISRVKSVDLDSWTDEQLASMVKWGNSRANKYWEANLAPGHVPSEAKIENFIRTKYESKRWVMDGGIPDPSTLDDSGDEEIPLKVVKQQLETRNAAPPPVRAASAPPKRVEASLFDDDDIGQSVAPISAPRGQVSSKAEPAPPKSSKPGDSLLGFDDFFGPPQQATPRPESVNSNPGGGAKSTRPDLKTSILSLYSSAPKQQPARGQHQSSPSFGNITSFGQPSYGNTSPPPPAQQSTFSDFNDAFSGLSFSSQPQAQVSQPPKQTNAFANLTSPLMTRSPPVAPTVTAASSGGFFGAPAAKKPAAFTSNHSHTASAGLNDLFSLSTPPPQAAANTSPKPFASSNFAFENAWSTPSAAAPVSTQTNVWGSSNNSIASNAFAGLGTSSIGSKSNDDDFGAFSGGSTSNSKLEDDIFGNVWK